VVHVRHIWKVDVLNSSDLLLVEPALIDTMLNTLSLVFKIGCMTSCLVEKNPTSIETSSDFSNPLLSSENKHAALWKMY
jgi:hypothetical protein